MDPGAAVCSDDVDSISRAPHRICRTFRYHTAVMHGTYCVPDWPKEGMDLSLFRIRSMECHHHVLGM